MASQNVQKFNVGDKVIYNSKLYKVTYIYANGELRLQSIRGKSNEIIFSVPTKFVKKLEDT